MTIQVRKPGLLTTVQDLGRYGYAHLGISPAGAADRLSFRIANLLAGNGENAPALEMTLLGATLEFDEPAIIVITGAECECRLDSSVVPLGTAFEVPAGALLRCGSMLNGARSYLAVRGGFEVPRIMGSAATDVRGCFGGFGGRGLQRGDVLHVCPAQASPNRSLPAETVTSLRGNGPIRVTRGAQQEWFGLEAFETFFSAAYNVSDQSDRAGLRLKGATLRTRQRGQLLTDGISLGAIQVPLDGQPIILFVDQQTTGGYPKIANVVAADMHRVGQLRPREELRFAEVSMEAAIEALRQQEAQLKEMFS